VAALCFLPPGYVITRLFGITLSLVLY